VNEFELIERFFRKLDTPRPEILLGIGDDAALIAPSDKAMVVCTDTMVAGTHFMKDDDPADVGFKSLAVNLSDLAAMGATPMWSTLNLTMPRFDEQWLTAFCQGFSELAVRYQVPLIGGDTTRGPLTISVLTGGQVVAENAMRRDRAAPGDSIYISSAIGDGHLGLAVARGDYCPRDEDARYVLSRLRRPEPAIHEGQLLCGISRAAIDVSDGLVADLSHVLKASGGLGADLKLSSSWFSPVARRYLEGGGDVVPLITGGDDYVLLFTVKPSMRERLDSLENLKPCEIGSVVETPGIRIQDEEGNTIPITGGGYAHFDKDIGPKT
jgi:thiamine-monophosphate kinase